MNDSERITFFGSLLKASDPGGPDQLRALMDVALAFQEKDDQSWALSEIAQKLAQSGYWDNAETVARRIEGSYERAIAIATIARGLLATSDRDRAIGSLEEAAREAYTGKTNWVWQKAQVLSTISKGFLEAHSIERALATWEQAIEVARTGENNVTSQDSEDCSAVLRDIARDLAGSGYIDRAFEVAHSIRNQRKRESALDSVRENQSTP